MFTGKVIFKTNLCCIHKTEILSPQLFFLLSDFYCTILRTVW